MKELFKPTVEEDLNREYTVTLTEGQIATILYVMEGAMQGNDEYAEEDNFSRDVDSIFETLEGAVNDYYAVKEMEQCIVDTNGEYRECVDKLVETMEKGS
jgi:hypothetical protein